MEKAFAEFVKRSRLERHLSVADVEHNSNGEISKSYISRIETGLAANVTPEKLDALARGLGVPADDLYRAARGLPAERPKDRLEILAETFDGQELTESDWIEIEAVLKTMIDQKKAIRNSAKRGK